nr:hypothetical protein CFP56_44423 [Quercus suber]
MNISLFSSCVIPPVLGYSGETKMLCCSGYDCYDRADSRMERTSMWPRKESKRAQGSILHATKDVIHHSVLGRNTPTFTHDKKRNWNSLENQTTIAMRCGSGQHSTAPWAFPRNGSKPGASIERPDEISSACSNQHKSTMRS